MAHRSQKQIVGACNGILCWIETDMYVLGAETTMKRFWKTASVEQRGDELTVTLDGRPLRTPSGNVLLVPASKLLLATMVATEWENQERLLKPHSLPLVCLIRSIKLQAVDIPYARHPSCAVPSTASPGKLRSLRYARACWSTLTPIRSGALRELLFGLF